MKMRNKGKVHPFTSSSSSSSPAKDPFPVLKLLPAAIFTLISVLSLEDREVLAYMITRSLNPSAAERKSVNIIKKQHQHHQMQSPASFDCDCFHCYTSFWFRWDSSPNRELIHQAIEAFEDEHLINAEDFKKPKNKKKDKTGRRKNVAGVEKLESPATVEKREKAVFEDDVAKEMEEEEVLGGGSAEMEGLAAEEVAAPPRATAGGSKGLARKVLPDVMGIFNSRLWSLWGPSV